MGEMRENCITEGGKVAIKEPQNDLKYTLPPPI